MSLREAVNLVAEIMPKMNPILAEGVAYHQVVDPHVRIDALMKIAFDRDKDPRLPEGFKYLNCDILTPEEDYEERARSTIKQVKNRPPRKKGYNMAKTDTYIIRCNFENDGRKFSRHAGLLFTRRGGYSHVAGTKYQCHPVLKTRGISLTQRGYFVEFNSSKVYFEWLTHNYLIDGENKHVYMPYSVLLHQSAKRSSKTTVPPLACWLFGYYGMKETFERFNMANIAIYENDDPALADVDTSIYSICRSAVNLRGRSPTFSVVIAKDQLCPEVEILIGSIYYIARMAPERFTAENMDDPDFWKMILGYSIHGINCGLTEQRIVSEIRNHFYNIETMLDVDFQQELLAEEIFVTSIYEFIYYIIETMTQRSVADSSEMASLYGKYITCIEYLTYDLRRGIFKARWDLINAASDSTGQAVGGRVNTKKVTQIIAKYIGTETIERIKSGHGEVSVFMTTTDNMVIGMSSHVIDQADTRKVSGGGKKSFDLNDPSKHLHASFAEVGSAVNLSKASPICWARFNMFTNLNGRLRIVRNPDLIEITNAVQFDISQKGM